MRTITNERSGRINAYNYITTLDPTSKRIIRLAILIPVGMIGIGYSISLISEGVKLLIESGVSEIQLKRLLGWTACFVGAMAFYESIAIPYRAFKGVFEKTKIGDGKIRVTIEQ